MIVPVILVVVLAIMVPVLGLDYHLRRVMRFRRRRPKKESEPVSLAIFQRSKGKVSSADVRDFVMSLQLATSMEAGLSWALAQAAEQFANRGLFGERLQRHVEARLSISPEAVLEGLIEDFDSPYFIEILERARTAGEGGVPYSRVFALTASEVQDDIRGEIEQRIQKAPTKLSPIMTLGLFMPVLILALAPLLTMFATGL